MPKLISDDYQRSWVKETKKKDTFFCESCRIEFDYPHQQFCPGCRTGFDGYQVPIPEGGIQSERRIDTDHIRYISESIK